MKGSARLGVVGLCGVGLSLASAAGCLSSSSSVEPVNDGNPSADAGEGDTGTSSVDASTAPDGSNPLIDSGTSADASVDGNPGSTSDAGASCTGDGGPGTFTCVSDLGTARQAIGIAPLAGGKALVAGGWNPTSGALETAEVFDSATGAFTPTGSMTAPHLWGAWGAGWPALPGGKILAAGGLDATGALLASAEIYDPTAGTFSATGPLHTAVLSMFPVVLQDQSVLFLGGWNATSGAPPTPGWTYTGDGTSEVQRYTPTAGTFADTGPLAEHRLVGCNVVLSSGKVLAIGGANGATDETNIEQYDPATGQWTTMGTLSESATACTQAFPREDGEVLLIGTGSAEGSDVLDPVALTTTATTGFPAGWVPYYVQLSNDDVLAYGGTLNGVPTANAMVYRGATNAWTSTSPMGQVRNGATTAALLTTGNVLIVGGVDANGVTLKSAELYHP